MGNMGETMISVNDGDELAEIRGSGLARLVISSGFAFIEGRANEPLSVVSFLRTTLTQYLWRYLEGCLR